MIRIKIRNGLTVFVYHDVTDTPSEFENNYHVSIRTDIFKRQIQWIKSNFNVIHPRKLLNDEQYPVNSAIITFDDGFLGSFENGLRILEEFELPSLFFLNMKAILDKEPILSAIACYLEEHSENFREYANSIGLNSPYHLTLTPSILLGYKSLFGAVNTSEVLAYQGSFADINTLCQWENEDKVVFANHLYEHWNAVSLTREELVEQYVKNENALLRFSNHTNYFAFTNGQPGSCFNSAELNTISELGAAKMFSSSGKINFDGHNYLLDRISMGNDDSSSNFMWYRVGRSVLNGYKWHAAV